MGRIVRTGIVCLLACFLTGSGIQEQGSISGTVKVRVLDELTGASETQYMLGGVILEFETPPHLRVGDVIDAVGIREGKVLRVEYYEVRERSRRLDTPLVRAPMAHTTAILATSDSSITRNAALGSMDRANAHWTEVTRGYDTLVGGVFEKYNINYSDNDCSYNNADRIVDRLVAAFEQDGYDADDYDHILTVIPRNCSSWTGAWAYIGGITDGGQLRFAQVSMYKDNVIGDEFFISHELGHNIGMNHARSMDCGSNPYYRPRGNGCNFEEYGNYNDNMGNGENVYYSGPYQRYLGWIDAGRVITAGKTSDFNLQPIDDTFECGIQAVRVPIPDEDGTYFYIEYRHVRSGNIYAGTGPANNKRNTLLITRSQDGRGGNASSFTDRVELDTNRYDGAEQGTRYNLGKGVAVRLRSVGAVAKVSIEMPGNSNHRDDNGSVISPNSDGTFGEIACDGVEDPYIAMSKNVYEVNEQIEVLYFNLPDGDTNWIAIYNRGAGHDSAIAWQYVQGANGSVTFDGQPEGNYDARLFFNDVADLKYEVPFRVEEVTVEEPRIEMAKDTYKENEKIKVKYFDLPKTDLNWIGIYKKGADQDEYLDWVYVEGAKGTARFDGRKKGNYEARLFFNDSYDVEDVVSFKIVKEGKCKRVLKGGKILEPGEFICSKNDEYKFGLRQTGKLVLVQIEDNKVIWTDGICCDNSSYLIMQKDGNLVQYGGDNEVLFSSKTHGNKGAKLVMRNSGVAVILDKKKEVIWSTEGDEPPPEDDPYIEMGKKKYNVGEQIKVLFFNLPDNNFWIGLFNSGAAHDEFLVWQWAQGGEGSVTFDGMASAGDYDARLFFTDSYDLVDEVAFKVEGDEPPPEGDVDLTLNPYAGVNWDWTQYKANYHAHTERSDGSDHPATVIDDYHAADYKILAITDHNRITWPWTDYGRNPDNLGMLAVKGDEWSRSHHMNPLHNFSTASSNMEDGIPHLQASGGVGQWNHPLRYSDAGDWDWYVWWAREYTAMVGMEVINGTNTNAKNLWDNVNENFYRTDQRFVWGHANDDSHHSDHIGKGFMFLLMPNLTKSAHLTAMRKGRSYFCVEPGGSGNDRVPRLQGVIVDNTAKTIKLTVNGANQIKWIGPGTNRVGTGNTFDYSNYKDKSFVRALLDGANGDCYTQPFGLTTRN